MLSKILFATLLAAVASVKADPTPTVPGPGDKYNQGSNCDIEWQPDASGVWKTMYIELMSGANLNMNHITTVATVDGTDPTKTTFTYPCPAVTPNSAIYFYQFTSPASNVTMWTTRFAIADSTGETVPPEHSQQPNGDQIPWGVGALVDPSQASPPPGSGSTNSSSSASSAPSGSASVSTPLSLSSAIPSVSLSSSPSVTPSGFSTSISAPVHISTSRSVTPSSSSSPSATGATSPNSAAGLIDSFALRGVLSFVAIAAAAAVAL